MKTEKTYYITTPIYYSSGNLHLGHCYTTVICDALARFKRMCGFDVFYLTGTDEHGQKVEQKAKEKGVDPQTYVDGIFENIVKLWKTLNISYNKLIRTTDAYHEEAVKKIYQKLLDSDDIYKASYQGWYCTPCESFWTESQLADGKCPDCGREVHLEKEESYFFRLSKYADRLLKLYEDNPDFIAPKSRMNEMVNNFIKPGLKDLCVSRTSVKWGIELPFDHKHVAYVWIDALANYITALGYMSDDDSLFRKYWPADLHMVGKEITRFHTIVWPALIMALDIDMPKQVYGHGWLLFDGGKMSKSVGNVKDPFVLSERYSVDAVRYYLLREIPFGSDGNYSNEAFLNRINADLCNSLGNLVSRTIAMIEKYFDGCVPKSTAKEPLDDELISICENALNEVTMDMERLSAPDALNDIFKIINRANKYIDETMPWALAKDETKKDRLATVLYNLAEAIRFTAVLLNSFLPETAQKIYDKLGLGEIDKNFDGIKTFGVIKARQKVIKGDNLFDRLDVQKELIEMEKLA